MEDFDSVHTVEVNGPKGWEVIWTGNSLKEAIRYYTGKVYGDSSQFRLTCPVIPATMV